MSSAHRNLTLSDKLIYDISDEDYARYIVTYSEKNDLESVRTYSEKNLIILSNGEISRYLGEISHEDYILINNIRRAIISYLKPSVAAPPPVTPPPQMGGSYYKKYLKYKQKYLELKKFQ